jgi:branched-chain amino acid transport system ATP-binding protein
MEQPILHVENLGKSFGGLKLFDGVNITLRPATINSLFGSNGSGKTTFFNMLGGYDKPDAGRMYFDGLTIKFHNEFAIAKAGIGRMWQEPTVFPNHTVLQNLLVSAKTHPGEHFLNYIFRGNLIRRREADLTDRARGVLRKFKLGCKLDQRAGSLSLGEKKLLSISMLLMNDARLLLLDEPFSSVNPDTIERISEVLVELREEGRTIFMIEHKIKFAKAISDHLFKIENHRIVQMN